MLLLLLFRSKSSNLVDVILATFFWVLQWRLSHSFFCFIPCRCSINGGNVGCHGRYRRQTFPSHKRNGNNNENENYRLPSYSLVYCCCWWWRCFRFVHDACLFLSPFRFVMCRVFCVLVLCRKWNVFAFVVVRCHILAMSDWNYVQVDSHLKCQQLPCVCARRASSTTCMRACMDVRTTSTYGSADRNLEIQTYMKQQKTIDNGEIPTTASSVGRKLFQIMIHIFTTI